MTKQSQGQEGRRHHRAEQRARHEYHIDERYEAGVALQGWEVKSLRAGRST